MEKEQKNNNQAYQSRLTETLNWKCPSCIAANREHTVTEKVLTGDMYCSCGRSWRDVDALLNDFAKVFGDEANTKDTLPNDDFETELARRLKERIHSGHDSPALSELGAARTGFMTWTFHESPNQNDPHQILASVNSELEGLSLLVSDIPAGASAKEFDGLASSLETLHYRLAEARKALLLEAVERKNMAEERRRKNAHPEQ